MQKLAKTAAAWALTAWALVDGRAVYRAGASWSGRFADASIFRTRMAADAALAAAGADVAARLIVNPYLFAVVERAGAATPASVREQIRSRTSETGSQKPEAGNQKPETRSRKSNVRSRVPISDFRLPISDF